MEANKVLIKKAKIIDPTSIHNGLVMDILIENETIVSISENIENDSYAIIKAKNLSVSPGWFDLRANFCDPGHEEKETIESGANAAIYGGFTGVAISPDTNPGIDSKALIEYIYKKAEELPINIYPYGAITKKLQGKELSEMFDMQQAGAIAFSDGKSSINNLSLLKVALQYQKGFGGALHLSALNNDLAKDGQMHEGEKSTLLGLKGLPSLAEEIAIQNILQVAEYVETPIHLNGISSEEAVSILTKAQKNGNEFTADVSAINLFFTDSNLESYDTRFKIMPPLRAQNDKEALIRALNDGVIQAIASDHSPENIENKMCEFEHASFGAIALESFIGSLGKALDGKVSWEKIIELISINPRRILGLAIPTIQEGSSAELSFFDTEKEWVFSKDDIQSKSKNSPFIGETLKGKALGIYNEGIMVWLDN